jgi:hypothetical protein
LYLEIDERGTGFAVAETQDAERTEDAGVAPRRAARCLMPLA